MCPHTPTLQLYTRLADNRSTSVCLRGVVCDCATLQGARAAAPTLHYPLAPPPLFTLHSTSAPSFFTSAIDFHNGPTAPAPPPAIDNRTYTSPDDYPLVTSHQLSPPPRPPPSITVPQPARSRSRIACLRKYE